MQNGTPAEIVSRYRGVGFFGTIRGHAEPEEACALAMRSIREMTGCSDEAIRAFLASRDGRHFGEEVLAGISDGQDLSAAIEHVVECWTDRRTDARVEEEVGIPQGLPYLTGFVCMHEALLELSS